MASSSAPPACGWEVETGHGAGLFTEAELAAADQLVQLSGSRGWDDEASPSLSSSSTRSVNTEAVAWEMEEEKEVALAGPAGEEELDRRARKRYRLLSELYAATRPGTGACLGADTASGARKRKRHGEPEGKAAMARYDGDQSF